MNLVSLIGHLVGDPTHAARQGDVPRTFLTLGVARRGTTATDWIGVTVIGSAAEPVSRLPAGALVAVEAFLHATTAADGTPQLDVVATTVHQLHAAGPVTHTARRDGAPQEAQP